MGKAQKKTGKGRLDKYYKLAKEQGYRARSAFKLIQLNKKYAFLESSRCTVDLCAAPGGWLQVASKYMPVNSIIVGVDLVPIKPIPRVVTFAADITTPHCRNLVRGELKDWKADVILHDGAPNVGTAWIQDAYSQSELVLMSLKLAVEFLAKGGTFVTKVFRSVDYNNLIWVFNQLFGKVEATKPPSSRNVSAEIFVVCQGYLAPQHVDPKFLDPRHVFKAVSTVDGDDNNYAAAVNHAQANVFHPEKKRRQRDGYAEGDYILFKAVSASSFVNAIDPIAVLGTANKIAFGTAEEKTWLGQSATTDDVKRNCEDLKVLGKGDFKMLLKWRLALREELGLDNKTKETKEIIEVADVTVEVDEDEQITEELHRLNTEAQARAKRERKRANEVKRRTIQRMQLQMTAPLDIGLEQQDAALGLGQDDVFTSENVTASQYDIDSFGTGDASDADELQSIENVEVLEYEDERERKAQELERQLDGLYDQYQSRLRERDAKFRVEQARKRNTEREEWNGIGKDEQSEDDSSSEGGWNRMESMKGLEDDTSESSDDSDGDEDDFLPVEKRDSRRGTKRQHPSRDDPASKPAKRARMAGPHGVSSRTDSKIAQVWFGQDMFRDVLEEVDHAQGLSSDEEYADGTTDEDSMIEVSQGSSTDDELWDGDDDSVAGQSKQASRRLDLVTPETVSLAQQLVNRQTTKTKLINDGFHRYSMNSKEGLPSWFLDDEAQHYKPNVPVTKEAITALRQKQRALDARPIKKVAEAKARKKLRAFQRMQAAMKKAEGLNQTADMTEREKAQQIEKVLRKGLSSRKKKEVKLVVARGVHRGVKGRPKGVKGRYTMVDARMKKEVRAKKRTEKAHKRR